MNEPAQLRFDYGVLDPETRRFVQERAERIHAAVQRFAATGELPEVSVSLPKLIEERRKGTRTFKASKKLVEQAKKADEIISFTVKEKTETRGRKTEHGAPTITMEQ